MRVTVRGRYPSSWSASVDLLPTRAERRQVGAKTDAATAEQLYEVEWVDGVRVRRLFDGVCPVQEC